MKNELADVVSEWLDAEPGRTPQDLADLTGLSVRTVYNLLQRETKGPPAERTIDALARALPGEAGRIRDAAGRMSESGSPLALLVKARLRAKGLSYRDAEALARRRGQPIDKQQISRIMTGKVYRPTDDTLRALAAALSDSRGEQGELYQALVEARKQTASSIRYTLPPEVNDLPPEGWRALMAHMEYLLSLYKERD